ncbi:MAG: PQQ-like beta-propeller repeat protein [Anaerolineae bacterium]|nr:PQQ-like beta-propeller repeat protein [Anaerolineae bacterium]
MKRFNDLRTRPTLFIFVVVLFLGFLVTNPRIMVTAVYAQEPRPEHEEQGNVVRRGDQRFNYLLRDGQQNLRVELDTQDHVVSTQTVSESPSEAKRIRATDTPSGPSSTLVTGSDPSLLDLEWKYGLFGSGIGLSRMSVFDIDNDDSLEMIMGGSAGGGFGADDFWYVVEHTGSDQYDQVWSSEQYGASIARIAVADTDHNQIGEIYVGLSNGTIYVYDGLTLEETGSFSAAGSLVALVVADVEHDGSQEIVVTDGSKIYVYAADSFALEWAATAYGGSDIAVANVDADAAPEIVTTTSGHGYVIDGLSHNLEWDYVGSFGSKIQLGDIDSDGMAEIVGAASWYKITAFDVDIKTPKWEIATSLDIGALRVADTDGDNVPEVLYGDGQWGSIHCFDGATKTQRWAIKNPDHGVTDIAVGDVNHDNVMEVLWGAGATSTGEDHLHIADIVTGSIEWQNIHLDGPLSAVDVGDVDDDGQDEIVMVSYESNNGYDDGIIHIFDATTHALEWRSTDLPNIHAWTGVKSLKISDVDDDGDTEFVIATAHLYDGLIQIYNGKTHALERQSPTYNGASFTALGIADVDNDGETEIVVGQDREHTGAAGVYLIVFDGATATEEWKSVGLDTYWGYVYDIELADVDNDTHIELIASLAGSKVYIYDGVTHQLDGIKDISAYALETFNVDADSQTEILVGTGSGVVEVYNGATFEFETEFKLGNGAILGLLVDDVDQDGQYEWLISEAGNLSIYNGVTKALLWRKDNFGQSTGYFNHLNSRDLDFDGTKEVVLGSSFALYQFGSNLNQSPRLLVYLPSILRNHCTSLYTDNFENPASGWYVGDNGNVRFEYLNDEYRLLIRNPRWWAGARPNVAIENAIVTVDVRNVTGEPSSYGLQFGIANNWSQFYSFEITPDGYYNLFRYSSNSGWTLLARDVSPHIYLGQATNRLRIVRSGSQISAYANGQLLKSLSDSTFTGTRYLGVIVTSFDEPDIDVRFDNFTVDSATCDRGTTLYQVSTSEAGTQREGSWKSDQNLKNK